MSDLYWLTDEQMARLGSMLASVTRTIVDEHVRACRIYDRSAASTDCGDTVAILASDESVIDETAMLGRHTGKLNPLLKGVWSVPTPWYAPVCRLLSAFRPERMSGIAHAQRPRFDSLGHEHLLIEHPRGNGRKQPAKDIPALLRERPDMGMRRTAITCLSPPPALSHGDRKPGT